MNYELFHSTLNRTRLATTHGEVEACVSVLYSLTDHGGSADRITAEEAIMTARRRVGALPPVAPRANASQVGGGHYKAHIQHWDFVIANDLGYFEGQITKYITRWRKKNGVQDLLKARHFLDKLIEVAEAEGEPTSAYVNQ